MAAMRLEDVLARPQPTQERQRGVEEERPEGEGRHRQDLGHGVSPHRQWQHSQQKPTEGAPHVAHENASRMPVAREKSDRSTCEGRRDHRHRPRAAGGRRHRNPGRHRGRRDSGDAVAAIHEVEGIGQTHDPEHR